MKVVNYKSNASKLFVVPFGDLHYGAKECNIARAKETIAWIKDNPDARVLLMGDYMDSATRTSVGAGAFDNDVHGDAQYEYMIELLKPIRKKILAAVTGNHEERIRKDTGYDITKLMCKELDIPYLQYGGFVKVRIRNNTYIIYITHGASGASLPYTKIRGVLEVGNFIDADIICYGHVHSLQVHAQEVKKIKGNHVERDKKYYVLTGHYLNYEGSYAEMKGYRPEKQGSPTIELGGKKRDIRVVL